MRKLSKKLIIASLLVLPAILGGCFLVPQGQNTNEAVNTNQEDEINPETGWKIYRNPEYGFSLEYPAEWYLDVCGKNLGPTLLMFSDVKIVCNGNFDDAKISVEINKYYDWQNRLDNYKEEGMIIDDKDHKQVLGDLPFKDSEGNVRPGQWIRIIDTYIPISDKDEYIVLRFHRGYGQIGINQLNDDIKIYNDLVASFRFIQ